MKVKITNEQYTINLSPIFLFDKYFAATEFADDDLAFRRILSLDWVLRRNPQHDGPNPGRIMMIAYSEASRSNI